MQHCAKVCGRVEVGVQFTTLNGLGMEWATNVAVGAMASQFQPSKPQWPLHPSLTAASGLFSRVPSQRVQYSNLSEMSLGHGPQQPDPTDQFDPFWFWVLHLHAICHRHMQLALHSSQMAAFWNLNFKLATMESLILWELSIFWVCIQVLGTSTCWLLDMQQTECPATRTTSVYLLGLLRYCCLGNNSTSCQICKSG